MRNTSLNHLVFDFLELYRANHKDTDSLEDLQVREWIHTVRAAVIKNMLDKNPFAIDSSWTQSLGEVEVSDYLIPKIYMIRTEKQLPQTINRRGGTGTYTHIAPVELFSQPYELITYNRSIVSNSGVFNKRTKYAFEKDFYLYIKNESQFTLGDNKILVEGVFQNPEVAAEFAGIDDFDSNHDYPIDRSIYDFMKKSILDANFRFVMMQVEDNITDGTDSTVNQNHK